MYIINIVIANCSFAAHADSILIHGPIQLGVTKAGVFPRHGSQLGTLIELSHAVFEKNTLPGLDYIYIYMDYMYKWLVISE